jgi:hypothetical protein
MPAISRVAYDINMTWSPKVTMPFFCTLVRIIGTLGKKPWRGDRTECIFNLNPAFSNIGK